MSRDEDKRCECNDDTPLGTRIACAASERGARSHLPSWAAALPVPSDLVGPDK